MMTGNAPIGVQTCSRCGHAIKPRGGLTPRYCAVCGCRLTPERGDVSHRFRPAARPPAAAIAALVLGILALTPMFGFPLGLAAIGLGLHARQQIKRSSGRLGGSAFAAAGVVLGVTMSVIWLLVCLGAR